MDRLSTDANARNGYALNTSMKPLILLLLITVIALADGGAVQWRRQAGDLLITVFAWPTPLTEGPADLSLLVQNANGLEPVLDANVTLVLRARTSSVEIQLHPTHEKAQNKLLYATPVTLTESGQWQLAANISRMDGRAEITGTIEVVPPPGLAASYWGYVAFPALTAVLYAVRERLVIRKAKGSPR
jgi:hypothetical protein